MYMIKCSCGCFFTVEQKRLLKELICQNCKTKLTFTSMPDGGILINSQYDVKNYTLSIIPDTAKVSISYVVLFCISGVGLARWRLIDFCFDLPLLYIHVNYKLVHLADKRFHLLQRCLQLFDALDRECDAGHVLHPLPVSISAARPPYAPGLTAPGWVWAARWRGLP